MVSEKNNEENNYFIKTIIVSKLLLITNVQNFQISRPYLYTQKS